MTAHNHNSRLSQVGFPTASFRTLAGCRHPATHHGLEHCQCANCGSSVRTDAGWLSGGHTSPAPQTLFSPQRVACS